MLIKIISYVFYTLLENESVYTNHRVSSSRHVGTARRQHLNDSVKILCSNQCHITKITARSAGH